MNRNALNRLGALVPIVLSGLALALVLVNAAVFGIQPAEDEGAEAHIFQLLVAAQLPFIGVFIATADWKPLAPPLRTFGLQTAAILAALASVLVLT